MINLYSLDARISVKIGGVEFICSPMTSEQQAECLSHLQNRSGEILVDKFKQMRFAIKYSLKGIKGVEFEGKPFELEFDETGGVSDNSLNLISQLGQEKMLQGIVLHWMNNGICDPKYPGVEIEFPKATEKKSSRQPSGDGSSNISTGGSNA